MGDMTNGYVPQRYEPRCHVCNSNLRNLVDMMAAHAYRPTAIARQLQEYDEELCKKSFDSVRKCVERHIKEHLNFEQEALRKLVEEKAREAGIFSDEHKATLVTRAAVLDRVVQKGWKQLSDEDGRVPYEFVLKAIELQEQQEQKTASLMVDQLSRQLNSIIMAVKELVPDNQWSAIVGRAREIHDTPVIEIEMPKHELPPSTLDDTESWED